MVIVLLGYMGSGKSTIGKQLAQILNYDFIDLDTLIEDKEQMPISHIFQQKGEIYFRKKEHHYLKELLINTSTTVIALGGGTPCYYDNMSLLKNTDNVVSFYLKLSIPNLTDRLYTQKEKRPLISHINEKPMLLEFVGKHLFERSHFYNQADHVISTDNKSVKAVNETLITFLI